ncbi:hypothetical protein CUMW_184470 [Citrus unshiu]|nr:hypothetical protein CUMW_184470 [Citrus unshiu]
MGNPEAAGSSAHQQAQEYEIQPQEYQYENTAPTYEQQEAQPPPQANQGYRAQTPGPAIVPHTMQQNNQTFPNGPNQPVAAYPPQGPQTIPAHPVKFPPPGPQAAVPFPPPSQQRSPVHPQVTVQTTPMMYPQATAQMPPTVGYQAPPKNSNYERIENNYVGLVILSINQPLHAITQILIDEFFENRSALVTACFPCLTFGQLAEIVDDGHTTCGTSGLLYAGIAFCIAIPCIMSCTYRTKLRSKFNLPEAPAPDWITHCLCEWCALCQEYRELQSRGWDPSIGYQGNLARNQNMHLQQATMMAPMNQRMMG